MLERSLDILIIPGIIPFPPDDGGKICIYGFVDSLKKNNNISLVLKCYDSDDIQKVQELKRQWPEVNIYHTIPEMVQNKINSIDFLIHKLKKIIVPLGKSKTPPKSHDGLDMYRTTPFFPHPLAYINLLIHVLKEHEFDIVQTELTEVLNLVHLFPKKTKKVFVQIENRGEVINDYGNLNSVDTEYLHYVVTNTEFLEYKYMELYDAIFTLNDLDRVKIQNRLPNVKVFSSPFAILDRDILVPNTAKINLKNLIFVGGEAHYPNVDGLEWFLEYVSPRLNNISIQHIYITGKWSDNTKKKIMTLDERVSFLGFVEDLSSYLQTSISIVPIRIGGGGIRTKILLAMAQCSPVISTSIAAVGISDNQQNSLWIADTIDEFVTGIEYLIKNPKFTANMIETANQLIHAQYSQDSTSKVRNSFYRQLVV